LRPDNNSIEEYIFISKYSRYLPEKKRRETFIETCDRVKNMFIKKYPNIEKDIEWAFTQVHDKKCLPSMRAMQFGGKPIEAHNSRLYNCGFSLCDRIDFFNEAMYLLLSGVGIGFSVEFEHVEKLPSLVDNIDEHNCKHHIIDDTIEGWANAIKELFNSYITGKYVEFSYSLIRPFGAPLVTSGGKAPGHVPLRKAIEKCRLVLNNALGRQLKPIECYDIIMHCADAVLAGGVRRSACICLFSQDDGEMINAKRGNWFVENPQRARSNNSVKLIRKDVTEAQFMRIFQKQKEWGEPGFFFANHINHGTNPCQPEFATVLTKDGIKQFKDIDIGTEIWSETGWTKVINKWSNGVKEVLEYKTTSGSFIGTENHNIVSNGNKVQVSNAESIDVLAGYNINDVSINLQDVIDGLVIGDGSIHLTSHNKVFLNIGEKDLDYFSSDIKKLIKEKHSANPPYSYNVNTTITENEMARTFFRKIPNRFVQGSPDKICGFLRGLYSANGSIVDNRISLKATSLEIIKTVQLMLSSIGIRSYFTTNKPNLIKWPNGEYISKRSYDLNISTDRNRFKDIIGFIQSYKNVKLQEICNVVSSDINKSSNVYDIESLGFCEVFDITVDNDTHTYWTGGLNVSNCAEISFDPTIEIDGIIRTGWQFCNLTEINGAKLTSEENFKDAVKAATIIGTCQAGFTSFPYLGFVSEWICRRDSLLGVSITGMMEYPEIALDPGIQSKMAKYAIEVNKEYSQKIDINQAKRVTCVKPAGTTSLVLGTASGIHPRHARRYFRRVQSNINDPVYKYFKSINPHMVEKSIYSANHTDDVITFCLQAPDTAIVKKDINALKLLKYVLSTQINWVKSGNITNDDLNHNVSNTITVKDDEWEDVAKFIWDNRKHLTGVTTLSDIGDKNYAQAPHEEVVSEKDEILWNEIIKNFNTVDYTKLYEESDNTELKAEPACAGGSCEL
jgi:hypothetical protein